MNAAIDFGNTRGKLGIFEGKRLVCTFPFAKLSQAEDLLAQHAVESVMVSNVGKVQGDLDSLHDRFDLHVLTHATPTPIRNHYASPQTLGMDRLAAVAGARELFPNQASLVVDLGTCITYDFVSAEGVYSGGSISPGMRMRAQALHEFTAKLPLVTDFREIDLVGSNTLESLQSGIINGVKHELERTLEAYKTRFGIFNTVFCGGDADFFETQAKAVIFVRKEIVLTGLNSILLHLLSLDSRS